MEGISLWRRYAFGGCAPSSSVSYMEKPSSQAKDWFCSRRLSGEEFWIRLCCGVGLVDKVVDPVRCVPRLDQLRNLALEYFFGMRTSFFYFPSAQVKYLAALLPFVPAICSFHSSWRILGRLQSLPRTLSIGTVGITTLLSTPRTLLVAPSL